MHGQQIVDCERFRMWYHLFAEYLLLNYMILNKVQRKNGKKRLVKILDVEYPHQITTKNYVSLVKENYMPSRYSITDVSLDTCNDARINSPTEKKKGNTMYYEDDVNEMPVVTDAARQRSYLTRRLNDAAFEKSKVASRAYGLTEDEAPKTVKDFIKRIQDGQFVLHEKYEDQSAVYAWKYISWQDPKKVVDKEGFEKFSEVMAAKRIAVQDTIQIAEPKDGLKALQEFEAVPVQ